MSGDIEFAQGLIVKAPHPKAPDFVKASISIKRAELIAWLQAHEGEWINLDVKESRNGKLYTAVNNWKPQSAAPETGTQTLPKTGTNAPKSGGVSPAQPEFTDDDIPF